MTAIEHRLTDPDVDLVELTRRIGAQTGQDLCFVARRPKDGDVGVLMFELAGTDVRVPVDPRLVVGTIDALATERGAARRRAVVVHQGVIAAQLAEPELLHYGAEDLAAFDAAATDVQRWAVVRAVLARAAVGEAMSNDQLMSEWQERVEHHRTCRTCNPTLDGTPT